jgi:hypothetical protein
MYAHLLPFSFDPTGRYRAAISAVIASDDSIRLDKRAVLDSASTGVFNPNSTASAEHVFSG